MATRDTLGKAANTVRSLLDKRIGEMLKQLERWSTPIRIDLEDWQTLPCGYKTDNVVPDPNSGEWSPFPFGGKWGMNPEEHRWFYKKVILPDELLGEDIELYLSSLKVDENTWQPQLLIYIDGKVIRGHESNHRYIKIDSSKKETDIHVYAYSCPFGVETGWYPQICVFNREVEKLYYNILTPYEVMSYLTKDDKEFVDIRTHLNHALNLVNWCEPMSEEFLASIKAANAYMESEFYGKYCGEQNIKVSCIGHTHIDVAWLWTLEQTKEKVQRTFGSVAYLMKKYPEYKFMSSQPQLFEYLKEEAPDIYAEFKQLVKEGRVEPEGSMWLEADCNLTSGESLVRQILFGKRFFKEEFGVDNKVVWLPDVFGYSAAMPQIMKKSGIDKFVTSKISWNESNRMPYDNFMWKGIDGTRIFSTFLTSFYRTRQVDFNSSFFSDYNTQLKPQYVRGTWDRYEPKFINNEVIMPFGYGDGGGGPTSDMLERYDRMKRGIPGCPQTQMEFAGSYLERTRQKLENNKRLPEWSGELYLEFHRGTYTSQANTKRNNRKSEFLYQNAETAAAMASKLTGAEYPQTKLNEGWKSILLHQFHDILPGSSIHAVYEECDRAYAKLQADGSAIENEALSAIMQNISTDGGVAVFNPNSFVSNGYVAYNGKTYKVNSIPAKGYKVVQLAEQKADYTLDGRHMETDHYIVDFDEHYVLVRLYDKQAQREVLREGGRGNYIEAFEDYPYEYDNWELSAYYTEKKYEIDDVTAVAFVDEGARFGFEITRKFYKSIFKQTIYFYDGSNRIDFDTYADWHQEHLMIKAAFDVDINSDKATYEIQFGSVERPVHKNTSWEAAKFEVCAHKYIDYSDYGYGVSLLNDCKYGHNIDNGTMKISLFKCGTHPDPMADKGEHRFVYSILPHTGNYRESGTVQTAYELNRPLKAFAIGAQSGNLSEEYSFLSCDKDNFIVETVKKAEDSDALIVRGYESYNMRTPVKLQFGFAVKEAYICDLMENVVEELAISDNSVSFIAKPFEIVSIKVI